MPVIHTPLKSEEAKPPNESITGSDSLIKWKITTEDEEIIVQVNKDQNDYLIKAPREQQAQLLQAIMEEQIRNQKAAATAAMMSQATLERPSPTPTEESLEEIKNRTKKEEEANKNTEVKKLAEDDTSDNKDHDRENIACRDRHHEFEQRTKVFLAAPAKKFIKACNNLMYQLDRQQFADEVSRQYGDELLKDVLEHYIKVEEARDYCLEPLDEIERLEYVDYIQSKFEDKCLCERIHRKYFEEQEEKKRLRQQQQQQHMQFSQSQVPPPIHIPFSAAATPLSQAPPPINIPFSSAATPIRPSMVSTAPRPVFVPMMSTPFPHPNHQFSPIHHGPQPQNQAGFNVYQDHASRIPPPSAPPIIRTHHHTRFKLNEELALVEKWDASQPRAYMAFRAQWTNFYEKMKKEDRSNLDLYYALLKVLGGSAKDLVHSKYPNDQSYDQAIKKLDDLFYNPTNLLREMVHNLLKGQKMTDTYDSLLTGINKLWDAWKDLDQADLTKDQLKGLLFIAATEKNLSEESWKCWLEVQNDPKYKQNPMAAFEISTYLGAMNKAMLNAQRRKNALGLKENNPKTHTKIYKKQSTLYGSYSNTVESSNQGNNSIRGKTQQQARGPNDTCITCGKTPHRYQLNCPKLKQMTANQIYKIMTNSGIECQMCLGLGHRTKDCPAAKEGLIKKCQIKEDGQECQRNHCRYLHKSARTKEESNQALPSKKQ